MRRLRVAHPDKRVEVWAEDEARLGLKPVTRRVWWLKGCRPRSCGRTRYEWLYVYGFARPATGETFTAIRPRVKVEPMADALAAFAALSRRTRRRKFFSTAGGPGRRPPWGGSGGAPGG